MGVLSKLPTHTPTVKCEVNPRHQLSRKSEEVPVLTAQRKGSRRRESFPKAPARAWLSERMSVIKKQASGVRG